MLRRVSTASVRGCFHDKWQTNSFDDGTRDLSRTNGTLSVSRKGVSINFVHDKNTWAQIEEIGKATGKGITRIETTGLDIMEEVLWILNSCLASDGAHSNISCLADEESYEVAGFSELYSIIVVVWRTV
jgi:hypothetical protein